MPGISEHAKESLLSAQCIVWQNRENILILSVTVNKGKIN
jgi:hypothetical protein